jgi:type IV secretion system protein VirD4
MDRLADVFPPRGSGVPGRSESLPSVTWARPEMFGDEWLWKAGRVLLGRSQGRLVGFEDDRHLLTVAGTRAGKTSTVLLHNLATYPGSMVVTDPKGELARATARVRAAMGQRVFVLDPFGELRGDLLSSASYNPFAELGYGRDDLIAPDAASAADALIIANEKDPHWTDSARNLIRALVLFLIATENRATIRRLRKLLQSPDLEQVFEGMVLSGAFDGIVSSAGASFLVKLRDGTKEFTSILSTAQEQTAPLDDIRHISDASDFALSDLSKGGMTIYAVLPGMRMPTHFRWLRLVVQMALGAVERHPVPRGGLPVLFMLEEFAALGAMRPIEVAAGLLAGSGVRLWPVVQDFTQLKANYPKSWETFIGNATVQAFAVGEMTTADYLSRMLGNTQVIERQNVRISSSAMSHGDSGQRESLRTARLLEGPEISRAFARGTGRQLVLTPDKPPVYMERMDYYGQA